MLETWLLHIKSYFGSRSEANTHSMRRLVMGDIHGAYKALKQCLYDSGFDYENDLLIQVGDAWW